ncbi:SEC-C metal-binding domain-containing protein [Caballeronia sp. AZ7_KS35]|uniref:SEC-C metal-binding domain-containing protein n=1 Tax=Caballeronia sp. AZ7_KS35 TaxID=2921762 RepID=UPI0020289BF3|nr:SEC-C metal-binding domain-containing protein [Caballeronia sp. AZ7_KS35]
MANIPAICERCGTVFAPHGIGMSDGTKHITVIGGTVDGCPKCGGVGHFVGGTYASVETVREVVQLLTAPGTRREQLERVAEILKSSEVKPRGEIEAQLSEAGPVGKRLVQWTEKHGGLAGWIGVVLTAIQLVAPLFQHSVSEADVERIVNERLLQAVPAQRERADTFPAARPMKLRSQETQSQNSPCSCGSGKKFKHCHGRKRWLL